MPTKAAFDLNQYLGVWYEQKRDKSILFEYGECVQAGYSKLNDGRLQLRNTQLNPWFGTIDEVTDEAECIGSICYQGLFKESNYQVIDTDYTNFSIVYSCDTWFFFFRYEVVWALTRG